VATALLAAGVATGTLAATAAAGPISLPDLKGHQIQPLAPATGVRATVVVFISIECPVSNRYAPELERLSDKNVAKGVRFFPVYANPAEQVPDIETHLRDYGFPGHALRDPGHALVKVVGASVTPEAAVFDAKGALVYHGRIDNRYVSLGVERPSATVHDLDDALAATLSGAPVAQPVTQAVGCFLADFVR
jgi:thiol-disulfide isomerase/thioredoxin